MFRQFTRDAIVMVLLLLGLWVLEAAHLQKAFITLDQVSGERLVEYARASLEHAYKADDDLSRHKVLGALAKVPGVTAARIRESHDGHSWGTLDLEISDHLRNKLLTSHLFVQSIATGSCGVLFLIYAGKIHLKKSSSKQQISDLQSRLRESEMQRRNSELREQWAQAQAAGYLEMAMGRIQEPLLVLDHRQRLVALNTPALERLEIAQAASVIGKSWHEISILRACGEVLEESLLSPGRDIERELGATRDKLVFYTSDKSHSGTWIGISVQ